MKHHRLLAIFSLLPAAFMALPAGAQSADTLRMGLEETITRALDISPEVGQVASERAFAEARLRLAKASRFLTEFRATSAHAPAPTIDNPNGVPTDELYLDPEVRNDWNEWSMFNQVETELLQPIYTWGELGGNIRAARHGVAVEEAQVDGKALEVAARTGELYYSLLLADALYGLASEAGDIVEQAKQEIQRLIDEGDEEVDEADLYQVRITEQEYLRRVVEVEERRLTARTALRRQLFLSDGVVVVPEDATLAAIPFIPASLETYLDIALNERPEQDQARAGLAAREALVDVARSGYYPKLFLGARHRLSGTPGRYRQPNPYISDGLRGNSLRAGLGMRLELNFAQTRARVQQARAERDEVRFQSEAARQLILFEVEEAYRNLTIARAALDASEESLTLSNQWLRIEQVGFDQDIGDTENLIDAVRMNLELKAARHEAVFRYNVAVLRLLRAVGLLADRAKSGTLVDQTEG
jgi:outer membrane protein TolC